jgi:hypothetical protein
MVSGENAAFEKSFIAFRASLRAYPVQIRSRASSLVLWKSSMAFGYDLRKAHRVQHLTEQVSSGCRQIADNYAAMYNFEIDRVR